MGSSSSRLFLLTGATGFLGRTLLASANPKVSYVPLLRQSNPDRAIRSIYWNSDISNLNEQLERFSLDGVIHLAAHYVADAGPQDFNELTDVSIRLSLALQDYAVRNDVPLIMATTRFVGTGEQVPLNLYAQLKKLQEESLLIGSRRGLRACRLEFGDIYGKGDGRKKFISIAARQLTQYGHFEPRNPDNLLYPVHHTDAARAVEASLDLATTDVPLYSITGPDGSMSAHSIVQVLAKALGKTSRSNFGNHSVQRLIDSWVNAYRPRSGPPETWLPSISLEEGIELLLATKHGPINERATRLT